MNKTDADIEKALECCMEPHSSCKDMGCPFQKLCLEDLDALQKYALDYINRLKAKEKEQQTEIERLKYNLKAVLDERADHSEAIKEFAERLCKDRVLNDPVVIAVKAELKMTENEGKE